MTLYFLFYASFVLYLRKLCLVLSYLYFVFISSLLLKLNCFVCHPVISPSCLWFFTAGVSRSENIVLWIPPDPVSLKTLSFYFISFLPNTSFFPFYTDILFSAALILSYLAENQLTPVLRNVFIYTCESCMNTVCFEWTFVEM